MLTEQDRINLNEYHYNNYKEILKAINSNDEEEVKAICVREMNIIDQDDYIENDNKEFNDKIKELDKFSKLHLVQNN
jgi:hypothetical protein